MTKTVITADSVAPDDPNRDLLIGATILSGSDMPKVDTVYESAEDAQVSRSLRLPGSLYRSAIDANHPQGFSGVVREALGEWLERHSGLENETNDVLAAVAVIQRFASRLKENNEPEEDSQLGKAA